MLLIRLFGTYFAQMRISFPVLILIFSTVVLHAQAGPDSSTTIAGHVTDSVTGRGIAGALVVLQAGPGKAELAATRARLERDRDAPKSQPYPAGVQRRAITDENGNYSFTLPEPTFASIQASHSGYLNGFNQTRADFTQGVNVKLVPTSVVEGRLVNSDGDPMAGVSVELIQVQIQDGRTFLHTNQIVRTNDLGEYRFWNITPSSVYLKIAGYRGTYAGPGTASEIANSSEAFPTVYYPAAQDHKSASVLRAAAGQTVRADFLMTSHPAYRIRGVIKDAVSYKNLGVRLMNGEDAVGNRVLINTSSGEFQVYDVMPGSYTLQAYSRDRIVAVGEASVTVKDQEVIGVEVTLSTGVDVQGTIERVGIDQNRAIPADDVNSYRQNAPRHMPNEPVQVVILQPGRIPITGTQPPAAVDADGHFTLRDMLPGKYAFVLSTFNEYVTSIRSGSVEVLADGLEIGTTSPAEIRVTLGSNGGIIHGIVTGLRAGEAATIALIRAAGIAGVPTIARTVIGQNSESTFFTGNLAPGEYLLYAWPSGQDVEYRNPEALRALSGNAVAVSLREHGNEQVTLKAIFQEIQ